jgi:S-adenosylmethionine hydrolase
VQNALTITRLSQAYAGVEPGQPLAIVGSSGFVELAVNQGRACDLLQLKIGDCLTIDKT